MSQHTEPLAESPDWALLRQQALRGLPHAPTPADGSALEGAVFSLRRSLLDELAARYASGSAQQEDALREALPPLDMRPGPFVPVFSAWRGALAAVLGLLAGSALAQGLLRGLQVADDFALYGGLAILCSLLGTAGALRAMHALTQTAATGHIRWPWGGSMRWVILRRWARWGWLGMLGLALLRDFMAGRDLVGALLATLGAFLGQGNALALFANIYTALALAALFAFCVHRPIRLDREAFEERLMLAAQNWWSGAACAAQALADDDRLRRENHEKEWRQVGRDLYSLAGELDAARRHWLEERLRRLGLEAPRDDGIQTWKPELADLYDMLGHLEPGDACYVDMPPLLKNGQLLRKGTVRKVRG